ncbi:MAG: POTRA domain-containing protein [bacterium]
MPRLKTQIRFLLALLVLLPWGANVGRAEPLRVLRVTFSGQRTIPPRTLQKAVSGLLPKGRVDASRRRRAASDVQRALARTLRGLGYLGATATVTEFRPGNHTSFVVFQAVLQEGSRYRIGALDVTGVSPTLRLRAMAQVRLRSGQFYDQQDLDRSRDTVGTVFADLGHAFVGIAIQLRAHPTSPLVDVTFHVTPGPTATIAALRVRGVTTTAAILIRRALLLRVGSHYHRTTLRKGLARLRRTGAFRALHLTETRRGPRKVELLVTAREAGR